MEKTTFLEEILEIEVPWYVEGADLDRESGTFSIRLDFEAGGTFACGACGLGECKAHDTCTGSGGGTWTFSDTAPSSTRRAPG